VKINTFGSLLSFAMNLEKQAEESYLSLTTVTKNTPICDLFSGYARRYTQRQRILEEIRQRNINVVLLEPITNLDSEQYVITINIGREMDINIVFDTALNIESKLKRFYCDALQVAGIPLGEVARTLRKLSIENDEHRDILLLQRKNATP